MKDPINPNYYDEYFDLLLEHKFTKEQLITIYEFNAYKYLYRWKDKNGIEDLKKAIWYIEHMIELQENQQLEESIPFSLKNLENKIEETKNWLVDDNHAMD